MGELFHFLPQGWILFSLRGEKNNFTLNVFNFSIQLTIGDCDDWSRSLHFCSIFLPVFGLENCTEELAKMQWIVHYITHHQLQFFSYRRTSSDVKWPRCPSNEVTFVSKVISWLQMRFFLTVNFRVTGKNLQILTIKYIQIMQFDILQFY